MCCEVGSIIAPQVAEAFCTKIILRDNQGENYRKDPSATSKKESLLVWNKALMESKSSTVYDYL